MLRPIAGLLGACSVLLLFATTADAQVFRGRVLDASSGAPVAGGIVKAVGAGGEVGAGTLTDVQGAFALTTPTTFQVTSLSVERIGYATQSFDVARFGDPNGIELLVDSSPVELGEIVITAESLCRVQPGSGSSVQTIWEEARKSLEVTALTQSDRILRFETENFQRDLRPSDYSVLRGSADRKVTNSATPYRSIPIEQMTERGWVEGTPASGMDLFAPDAAVLMTEEFVSQHCFNAESSGDALLLHFSPNRERRSFPELEGTLVLDPETAELTELQFRYVGVAELRRGGHAGGEIEFFAAPNGLRVVQQWAIRAPAMTRARSGFGSLAIDHLRVDYVREEGGRVLAVRTEGGTIELPVEPLDLGPPEPTEVDGPARVASTRTLRSGGADLVLSNNDTAPYQVTAVQLRSCINTALNCGDYPVDVLIAPGETEVVFRLRQESVFEQFRFEWDYVGNSVEVPEEVASVDTVLAEAPTLSATVAAPTAERFRSSRVVTAPEIPEGRFANALEFVKIMRPQWLTTRPVWGPGGPPPIIRVYVDDISLTPSETSSTEAALREIPAETIGVIEWVDAPSATIRWGTGHQLGAIVVTTIR